MTNDAVGRGSGYTVIPKWALSTAGLVTRQAREIKELLPRYEHDNKFDSTKFADRFPQFTTTTYRQGLETIHAQAGTATQD